MITPPYKCSLKLKKQNHLCFSIFQPDHTVKSSTMLISLPAFLTPEYRKHQHIYTFLFCFRVLFLETKKSRCGRFQNEHAQKSISQEFNNGAVHPPHSSSATRHPQQRYNLQYQCLASVLGHAHMYNSILPAAL